MNINANSEPLRPCPFCGGTPELKDWKFAWEYGTIIKCSSCEACISEGVVGGNGWHSRAIEKWNRRIGEEDINNDVQ